MRKKANGEGTVYWDASKNRFTASFFDDAGKRITKRFKERTAAQEWLTTAKADLFRGDYVKDCDITFGEWLLEYIDTYKKPRIKYSTLARYYITMKHFEALAAVPLKSITTRRLQSFINAIPPTLSFSSRKKIQDLLKSSISKAVALGMMKDVIKPLEFTNSGKRQKEVQVFTIEEIHKILAAAKRSQYYSRYYIFIKLAVYTGARLGELLALRKSNVSADSIKIDLNAHAVSGKMLLTTPKTASGSRIIKISPALAQELLATAGDNDFVFHTRYDTCWNSSTAVRAWQAVLKEAGVEYKNFHCLRHTHATQLLANGTPLTEVAKRLGHAKPSTTLNLYAHSVPGYDEKVSQKIDKIFGF